MSPFLILFGFSVLVLYGDCRKNESINSNPSYSYAYDVADDTKQLYQSQSQELVDQVVNGQYSWVDSLGTRHIVRYRADDTGFHVIEMKNEVGAVAIRSSTSDSTSETSVPLLRVLTPIRKRIVTPFSNKRLVKVIKKSRPFFALNPRRTVTSRIPTSPFVLSDRINYNNDNNNPFISPVYEYIY